MKLSPDDLIEIAQAHRAADRLEARHFEMRGGKACSVGCFCHDLGLSPSDFDGLAEATGYPVGAHYLQEAIFEGLSGDDQMDWHEQFFRKAAQVDDWDRLLIKVKIMSLKIALPYDESNVVETVIALCERALVGDPPKNSEWSAAESAAESAAWSARSARSARSAAESAAWSAAWSARSARSAESARSAAWIKIRDAFLEA